MMITALPSGPNSAIGKEGLALPQAQGRGACTKARARGTALLRLIPSWR